MHPCGLVLSPTRELCLQVGRISFLCLYFRNFAAGLLRRLGAFFQNDKLYPYMYFSDLQRVSQVRLPHPGHFGSSVRRTWKLQRPDQQTQSMYLSNDDICQSIFVMSWELNAKFCSEKFGLTSSNFNVVSSNFFLARMPHFNRNSRPSVGCDGTGHHRTWGMQVPGPRRGRSYAHARHGFRTPDSSGLSSSFHVIFDDSLCESLVGWTSCFCIYLFFLQIVEMFGMPQRGDRVTAMFSATFPKEIQVRYRRLRRRLWL